MNEYVRLSKNSSGTSVGACVGSGSGVLSVKSSSGSSMDPDMPGRNGVASASGLPALPAEPALQPGSSTAISMIAASISAGNAFLPLRIELYVFM